MDNYSLYVLFAKDLRTIIFVENIFKYHHNPQYEDQLVKWIILRTWRRGMVYAAGRLSLLVKINLCTL